MIGVVGGVGPYAGLDLNNKIFEQTIADTDQDHLSVILLSDACSIPDRTGYLLGDIGENPALGIVDILMKLEAIGATVACIPCNTAHAAPIFDAIKRELDERSSRLDLVHMVDEVTAFVQRHVPNVGRLGILATTGTVRSNVYGESLRRAGYEIVYPEIQMQEEFVHPAIYDRAYGIKARPNPPHEEARRRLEVAARQLIANRAEAIVLGCTELPLAFRQRTIDQIRVIDANLVLARALVGRVAPDKLRPWTD
jgi:aspartate racemase